jgi:hypothetical protein
MIFRTTTWQRLAFDDRDLDQGFRQHLIECAKPSQLAYRKLMRRFDGNPVGVECVTKEGDRWAFVLPDLSCDGKWRIQYFDEGGFSAHSCFGSLEEAVEDMIQSGYREIDAGALDRVASTDRWALGVKRSAIHQRQEGLIDSETMWSLLVELQQTDTQ